MHLLFEPGLGSSAPVHTALVIGVIAAIVGAVTGVFAVMRRQSFAAHALTDVATTGGAAATYAGTSVLGGFLAGAVLGATSMDLLGSEREAAGRDVATGVVLGAATGLSALVLYLEATQRSSAAAVQTVLFGSIFTVSRAMVVASLVLGVAIVAAITVVARPLILSTVSGELASSAGLRPRWIGAAFAGLLGLSVGLAALVTGSILATALVIGPAAIGCRWCARVRRAACIAALIGAGTTVVGVVLAYDSADWISNGRGLPASFFIVSLIAIVYIASEVVGARRRSG